MRLYRSSGDGKELRYLRKRLTVLQTICDYPQCKRFDFKNSRCTCFSVRERPRKPDHFCNKSTFVFLI